MAKSHSNTTSYLTRTHPPDSHPAPPSLLQEVVPRVLNDGTDIVLQRGLASCWWQALFTDCRVLRAGRETFPFPWTRRMPRRWGGTGCKLRLAATFREAEGGRGGMGDKEAGRQRVPPRFSPVKHGKRLQAKRSNRTGC